ncbi:MAG TPA: hypothetical protein VLH36_06770 [Steroidobacteraceae bacterium]|jgi:hypothetical protein|nr:hypothetical protein [Steroidobacteraceae bacterium]
MVKRFMAPGPWITRDLKECVLASDYDALAAERDALSKDAERYRWLRDSAGNDIMEKLMAECSPPRWDELVDAAIDAAMGERP